MAPYRATWHACIAIGRQEKGCRQRGQRTTLPSLRSRRPLREKHGNRELRLVARPGHSPHRTPKPFRNPDPPHVSNTPYHRPKTQSHALSRTCRSSSPVGRCSHRGGYLTDADRHQSDFRLNVLFVDRIPAWFRPLEVSRQSLPPRCSAVRCDRIR